MPDSTDTINPQALRAARKRHGLSQQQLAEAIGCTKDTVSRWERGASSTVRSHLRKPLSDVLRVKWEDLTKPADQTSDVFTSLNPTVRVSIAEHARASLQLVAARYAVRPQDVLDIAPLLFVIIAERSLLVRRHQFQEMRVVLEEAGNRLGNSHVDLGGDFCTAGGELVDELLSSEEDSLNKRDVFGRNIPSGHLKDAGPFVHFVRNLAKDLPEDAVVSIDSIHGEMIHRYRIADDTLRDRTGISEEDEHGEELLDHIHSGLIDVAECLRVKRDSDEARYHQWLSDELLRANAESKRRLEEAWNSLGLTPDAVEKELEPGSAR